MEYEKRKRYLVNLMFAGLVGLIVYAVIEYGIGMVFPFLLAFLFAYTLRRPALFLYKTIRLPYKLVAFLLVLLFYCSIGVLLTLLGVRLISVLVDFISSFPPFYQEQIVPGLSTLYAQIEQGVSRMDPTLAPVLNDLFTQLIQSIGSMISDASLRVVSLITGYASSLPLLFIRTLLMVISTFFIAVDYDQLTGFVSRQFTGKILDLMREIRNYVVDKLFVCIRAYALIITITFTELSIGFTIIGLEKSILIAAGIAVFDILPVLGTGGILVPWIIVVAIMGKYSLAVGLLIIYLVVVVVRNILEPKIVGSQIGLHPVVTLISLFVGAQMFGVIGLLGFPITLSLLKHLNETGAIRIFK